MIKLYDVGMEPIVVTKGSKCSEESGRKVTARLDFNTIKNLLFLVEHPDPADPDLRMAA